LGEVQLGSILSEILPPEQYAENVNTTGIGSNTVEVTVRLPGDGERPVWLPIDSKFPGDSYARLVDAYDSGDKTAVIAAQRNLIQMLRKEAKDIRDKYIAPPATTNFGILFLPFEGLYAEVVRLGMIEQLQRDYNVNIAGPTTMAALLNSLQMGFRTLAIQKRSGEVWQVLGAVKTELGNFEAVLTKAQKNLNQANNNLETLIGVRTRAMQRRLKDVTELPGFQAGRMLDLEEGYESMYSYEEDRDDE
ncbi:MAG: DNA recombination protein RmuC, partial [Mogibacterium sp.]|nr:DNA recombination protein RmuC [Mogibacterium sp.]